MGGAQSWSQYRGEEKKIPAPASNQTLVVCMQVIQFVDYQYTQVNVN
jgi:hypothetical protein